MKNIFYVIRLTKRTKEIEPYYFSVSMEGNANKDVARRARYTILADANADLKRLQMNWPCAKIVTVTVKGVKKK